MGFSVICHGCGKLLYQGRDLIPLYRLRRRTDGKCPSCGRKLAIRPLRIKFEDESDGMRAHIPTIPITIKRFEKSYFLDPSF